MAFANPDELRRWLRIPAADWTDDNNGDAEFRLELAQGLIEDEAGQPLESSQDTVTLDVNASSTRLVLPRWPVTAVASVTLTRDGEVLQHGPDGDYTWSQSGILTRRGGCWPTGDQVLQVVYTAGFVQIPKGLKRIALRLAGQGWDNPTGLQSETLGDHTRAWAAQTLGMELSEADKRIISNYRARTQS